MAEKFIPKSVEDLMQQEPGKSVTFCVRGRLGDTNAFYLGCHHQRLLFMYDVPGERRFAVVGKRNLSIINGVVSAKDASYPYKLSMGALA